MREKEENRENKERKNNICIIHASRNTIECLIYTKQKQRKKREKKKPKRNGLRLRSPK